MLNKILRTMRTYDMAADGEKVLACVSGGADSVCMLLLLNEISDRIGFSLEAAHVNHNIRGEEADRDCEFVKALCEKLNIPLHIADINVPETAESEGKSIELAAREARYSYFDTLGCDKIATAHTQTDRVETFLMNISRGCGLQGLCSIPPVRGNIIRPLYDFTREETEKCCCDYNVGFVTDSTNFIDDCTRNKFRLNIIPEICKINPSFKKNVIRCIESVAADNEYLTGEAEKEFYCAFNVNEKCLDITKLKSTSPVIFSRVLKLFFDNCSIDNIEKKHIDYILCHTGCKFSITLPGGNLINSDGDYIYLDNNIKYIAEELLINTTKDELTSFNRDGYEYSGFPILKSDYTPADNDIILNYSQLCDEIEIRRRKPGDHINLPGRNCAKSLKKYFNEIKLSQVERENSVIFADKKGIVAIAGLTADASRAAMNCNKLYVIQKKEKH